MRCRFCAGCSDARLCVPHKGKGGHIIWNQGFAGELANRIQNGRGEALGTLRSLGLKAFFYALQAEFQIFGFVIFAVALNHSPRNQKKNRAFLQANRGSFAGGVGEQAERQTGGASSTMPVLSRSSPGVCPALV